MVFAAPIWLLGLLPEAAAGIVAITAIGARLTPQPQVMVRLENHAGFSSVQNR